MQVDWKKFLTALGYAKINETSGALQVCPFHPGTEPSLRVQRDYITHDWRFLCQHNRCYFSGDAVTLLSLLKKISVAEALEFFKPDGALYHTLENTIIASHVEEFKKLQSSQQYIDEYMSRCQQTFRDDSSAPLRTLMADAGATYRELRSLETIPRTLGIVVQKDIPDILREFAKNKYRKGYYAVYPYTFESRYTCIKVQNFLEQSRPTSEIVVTRPGIGIFMEDHLKPETTEVTVASSELAACALHHKLMSWNPTIPAIIALAGLPLPFHYRKLKKLLLVSFQDAPVTMRKGLQYFTAPELVEGVTDVQIEVKDYACDLLSASSSSNLALHQHRHKPLGLWLLDKMAALIEAGRAEEIYDAFNSTTITPAKRTELLNLAISNKAHESIITILKTVASSAVDEFKLGTGNRVRRTPMGFQAVKPNGSVCPLSNVVLDVTELVRTQTSVDYICKVQSPDYPTALELRITSKDLRNVDTLKMVIERAFLDKGMAPYIAIYHMEGYGWPDIIAKLAADKRISRELPCLGVDSDLRVQLPNLIIDTVDRRILPQSRLLPFSPEMKATYAGLACKEVLESMEPIRGLIKAAHNNVYLAGLLSGICHITAQLHKHLLSAERGIKLNPNHMFYVSSNISDWLPTFQQLSALFSGAVEAPFIAAKDIEEHLAESACLGDMPWIVNVAGVRTGDIPHIVNNVPSSLISCLDYNSAATIGDRGNCSYVELDRGNGQDVIGLHPESIAEIRDALPGFLLEMLITPKTVKYYDYTSGRPQAVVGYSLICQALNIEADDLMHNLVKLYCVDQCFTGCHEFMNVLHKMFVKSQLQTVYRMPVDIAETKSPSRVFIVDNVVLVNKQLITAASKMHKALGAFKEISVTADFQDNKYLATKLPEGLTINPTQFWALDKSVWDMYVKKEPLILPFMVEAGQILKLERIA